MQNLKFDSADVHYYQTFLEKEKSDELFILIGKLFNNEENKMINDDNDKPLYRLNRKTIVYVELGVDITIIPKIWGVNVTVLLFPKELILIKQILEETLHFKFNICLVNYYVNGKKTIGWHSDNEEKGSTSCIASISLGAEREFVFRKNNSKEIYQKILLHHGSLIVMAEGCQENYQHSLRIDKNCKTPRLNLTFRLFDGDRYLNH